MGSEADREAGAAAPAGVPVEYPIDVVWEGGERFRGGQPGVPALVVDGHRQASPGPVDAVLVALAACSAIDVVAILEKRRTPAAALSVRIRFSRAPHPPRRLTDVNLHFHLVTAAAERHVRRAVELSITKYCSVASSLAPDTRVSWTVEAEEPAGPAGREP